MSDTADRAFVHTRLIDATTAQVFAAVSDASKLARWWGPAGFTSTFHDFDFRVDGLWRFELHGPDGKSYPNENRFAAIDAPTLVVIDHISDTHHFLLTISFTEEAGGTRVGWRQVFDTVEHAREIAGFVAPANEQNLDRLEAVVMEAKR